ncbi:MAG: FHA domain-containing protein [Muribaculaceae bacterium]
MSNPIIIGRSRNCNVVVPNERVSREHARITVQNGQFVFENVGANGSTLNGQPLVGPTIVNPGDNIMLAGVAPLPWNDVMSLRSSESEGTPTAINQQPAPGYAPQQPAPGYAPQQPAPGYAPQQPAPGYQQQYPQQQFAPVDNTNYEDLNIFLKIISFLFPIVGIVLYFIYRNSAPNKASQAGKWAGIGFAVGMVLNVLAALG